MPVEEGDQRRRPLPIGLVPQQIGEEGLIFPEHVRAQFLLQLQLVLQAVKPLLHRQVEQVVDADTEGFRQKGQQRDIRQGRPGLPFGDRLGTEPQRRGQLLLGQPRAEAELADLFSQFHM